MARYAHRHDQICTDMNTYAQTSPYLDRCSTDMAINAQILPDMHRFGQVLAPERGR